ncbi:UPF0146 family protein [Natranaeroarchaeum sulfidigenes]|uniref:UPF0146 protein AArcS_2384 n=1 Tax=Natranaeroarchaeum sulfidigenes TaxID=2784880 RepID=A0A897MN25_9EURY|nr:UPF0146 family protein [Natranaeroarchaeum sulfidigenes]QSG03580.1 putative small methyltransferase [Natranaeroarchaeum sulfidigenes]
MPHTDSAAIADRLARFDRVVEVGVGRRPDVAGALADRGVTVTATDITPREGPENVEFVLDDITDPTPEVYADADAIYALDLPPELHRPTAGVAREHDAVFVFTTLGGDPPAIPVERETLPTETLYWAREGPS